MRDPKRIVPMIEQFRTYWVTHPDLRFWQVVEFMKTRLSSNDPEIAEEWGEFDPFYTEDDETLEVLERMNQYVG